MVSVTFQGTVSKCSVPAMAFEMASRFVKANMAIHADAKRLNAETVTFKKSSLITFRFKVVFGRLPANGQESLVAT